MKRLIRLAPLMVLAYAATAGATPDATAQAEIDQLLVFVEKSGCIFIRGGDEADGTKARAHLTLKYDYAKKSITTADQFVRELASKSSMTGRPYKVRCSGRERESGEWLTEELTRLRAKR